MIIVHDIFICKPGNASKLAKMWKEAMGNNKEVKYILTDSVGQFNKVVMVSEYESLGAYEKSFEAYMNPGPEMKQMIEKMSNHTDMYLTGSREIYRVW